MNSTIESSYLVTQEVGIHRVEGADNVDGIQRHLGKELVAVKLTGSCYQLSILGIVFLSSSGVY